MRLGLFAELKVRVVSTMAAITILALVVIPPWALARERGRVPYHVVAVGPDIGLGLGSAFAAPGERRDLPGGLPNWERPDIFGRPASTPHPLACSGGFGSAITTALEPAVAVPPRTRRIGRRRSTVVYLHVADACDPDWHNPACPKNADMWEYRCALIEGLCFCVHSP
jgi:hypothetical protein